MSRYDDLRDRLRGYEGSGKSTKLSCVAVGAKFSCSYVSKVLLNVANIGCAI